MKKRELFIFVSLWVTLVFVGFLYPTTEVIETDIIKTHAVILTGECIKSRSLNMIHFRILDNNAIKNINVSIPFDYECSVTRIQSFKDKNITLSQYNGYTLEIIIGDEIIQNIEKGIKAFNDQDSGRKYIIFLISISFIFYFFLRMHNIATVSNKSSQ